MHIKGVIHIGIGNMHSLLYALQILELEDLRIIQSDTNE